MDLDIYLSHQQYVVTYMRIAQWAGTNNSPDKVVDDLYGLLPQQDAQAATSVLLNPGMAAASPGAGLWLPALADIKLAHSNSVPGHST